MFPPYVGEIMMFGGNFAPQGWAFCDGSLLAINQNAVLFNLIGTTYGGDGQNTFGLPDLRGRMPIHQGQGPGLSSYNIGQSGGTETVTLTSNQIPSHTHLINSVNANGNSKTPVGTTIPANVSGTNTNAYSSAATDSNMSPTIVGNAGGNNPHNNIQPILVINYCISLFGVFPSQN
jgi:microcystin-dependent protein